MKISDKLYKISRNIMKTASMINDFELLIDGKIDRWARKRVNKQINKSMYNIYRKIRLK